MKNPNKVFPNLILKTKDAQYSIVPKLVEEQYVQHY